jgi:hypothetical protein
MQLNNMNLALDDVVVLHPANVRFIQRKTQRLDAKDEVIFNLLRKEQRSKTTQAYRWGGIILRIILGLLMLWSLFIIPVMITVLRMEFDQPVPNPFFVLLAIILIPASIFVAIGGISNFADVFALLFPKRHHRRSLYRRLIRKSEFITGEVAKTTPFVDEEMDQRGTAVDYRFINDRSTTVATQFYGQYIIFSEIQVHTGDKVVVLYAEPKLHILL